MGKLRLWGQKLQEGLANLVGVAPNFLDFQLPSWLRWDALVCLGVGSRCGVL